MPNIETFPFWQKLPLLHGVLCICYVFIMYLLCIMSESNAFLCKQNVLSNVIYLLVLSAVSGFLLGVGTGSC